jgi:predicted PolB exonuclease-like 3'-5' exonuclease
VTEVRLFAAVTTRPLLAFDIETIPDPDVGRRLWGFEGNDETVIRAMTCHRLEETQGRTSYPQLPQHRIVAIAVAALAPATGSVRIKTVGGDAMDERSHLEGFFRILERASTSPRLVSWNGNGFDMPVIRYRSMLHGVPAPSLYRTDGARKWRNYQNRYHDLHVDLMDTLSGFGASHWVGLGTIAETLGLPGKSFLDGEVWEHIVAGDERTVDEYCKLDVVTTLLVHLVWEVHRGNLDIESVRGWVHALRNALSRESFAGWQETAAELEGWPRWDAADTTRDLVEAS